MHISESIPHWLGHVPRKSSLSYLNAHQDWQLFQDLYFVVLDHIQSQVMPRRNNFRNIWRKILLMDASVVPLCLNLFDWAQYRSKKEESSCIRSWITTGICPCYRISPTLERTKSLWCGLTATLFEACWSSIGAILIFLGGAFWTAAAFSSSQEPKQTWTGVLTASAKYHTKCAAVSRVIKMWKSAPVLQKLRASSR